MRDFRWYFILYSI